MRSKTAFVGFQLAAGTCDTVTGLLLVLVPSFTLRLMGVAQIVAEPIFVSFIGAFVFAVGLSYLLFLVPPRNAVDLAIVRTSWLITAVIRLCVGMFVLGACLSRKLNPAWLTVAIVDLSIATFQLTARSKWLSKFA